VKGTKTQTKKKESRYNREYERCMVEEIPEHLGRESLREKKNDDEIQMWEREERKHVLNGRRRKKVQIVL
jgi:hypothetical protein